MVSDWLNANGYGSIAEDCSNVRGTQCYQWKGTWLGKLP